MRPSEADPFRRLKTTEDQKKEVSSMRSSPIASTVLIFAFSVGAALAADLPLRKGPVYVPPPPPPLGRAFTRA